MSDDQARPRKPSRHSKPILSIRARLIVLALFALAPLMLERVNGLERARVARTEQARVDVMSLARRGADAQREMIDSTRTLLQVVARSYAGMALDPAGCNKYLGDVTDSVPWIQLLSIAGANGQIACSNDSLAIGLNLSDRPHFQQAVATREFALSDYLISRVTGTPSIYAAFPIVKGDGSVSGVVLASINLRWIGDLVTTTANRSGASVLLFDGSGTLIAASADQGAMVGQRFANRALVKDILGREQGTITAADFAGVRRIFAYVRVPWTQARLAVGLDEDAVHSGIDRELGAAYLELAVFAMFVLLVAWFGGEKLVVRPIRSLVRTATRFGRGDLRVRATRQSWLAEFEPLAVALDDMACKLAAREEELRIANQHLDELASLDGLTGLANRRGFDRKLEREWQDACERREPVALMVVDIDHFKLYNDRYGHVAGDTCLRSVAETLSLVTLDEAVLVARYGGEEFTLLLPGLDLERATALAEEARKSIEDLLITHAESPHGLVTISIGVDSLVPQPGEPPGALVEAADSALYVAKRRGRNTVVGGAPLLLSEAS